MTEVILDHYQCRQRIKLAGGNPHAPRQQLPPSLDRPELPVTLPGLQRCSPFLDDFDGSQSAQRWLPFFRTGAVP